MSGPERMNSLERINGPVVLAPMEGLADAPMRDVLTRIGGIDWCVSEFIRVTEGLLNVATIRRSVPESEHGWCTRLVPAHALSARTPLSTPP